MAAIVIQGDARQLLLPDDSVDLLVTSPPYWGLRSYQDGGETYAGQIGVESTPTEYVDALIDCTAEWMRVLKPSGSIFVNLGDKYASSGGHTASGGSSMLMADDQKDARNLGTTRIPVGFKPKSLLFLPERYRIACVDRLGLIARAVICWSKPNGLPESVTDRVRRSHEDWVHLVQQPRYFSAVDEIRESHVKASYGRRSVGSAFSEVKHCDGSSVDASHRDGNPLGKLPGSVWEIATQPLTVPAHLGVDHFAAFPLEWPRRIIRGWSPSGICTACGQGRRPAVARGRLDADAVSAITARRGTSGDLGAEGRSRRAGDRSIARAGLSGQERNALRSPDQIIGYACACPDATAPTRPSTVLDPFGGTGTTALVADVLGRTGISIDASGDYCRIARWRTTDPGERARALGVPKPPVQLDGQVPLFDLVNTTEGAHGA